MLALCTLHPPVMATIDIFSIKFGITTSGGEWAQAGCDTLDDATYIPPWCPHKKNVGRICMGSNSTGHVHHCCCTEFFAIITAACEDGEGVRNCVSIRSENFSVPAGYLPIT